MNALALSGRNAPANGHGGRTFIDSPFAAFHYEMDQLLDHMFNGFGFTGAASTHLPTVSAEETGTEYRVAVDLPGVELSDVELSFSEGLLTLKGSRKAEGARWSGPFERVIGIGQDVDENRISATLKNGVLSITLPKKPESHPRRIEVQ